MWEMKVIEPPETEWAAAIVFSPKKDGSIRFCVEYQTLNAVTKRDSYPIPRMDECITHSEMYSNSQLWTLIEGLASRNRWS